MDLSEFGYSNIPSILIKYSMVSVIFLKIYIYFTRLIMNIVKMDFIKLRVMQFEQYISNGSNTNNTFLYMYNVCIYIYIKVN